MAPHREQLLGTFLRDRRARLDPAAFGLSTQRRRTPGLRREEVAQRAHISPTWYTWLEQGRGGAPSPDVLDRIASALMLTDAEREHLFIVGLGRPPEVRYKAAECVTPRLQRLLDALQTSPAIIKTATWDVIAWNRAATLLLTDYAELPVRERNILRLVFGNSRIRALQEDWESVARFVIGAFRADVARAGAGSEVSELVDELSGKSPEFKAMWSEKSVHAYGEGTKRLRHAVLGNIELEYSSFAVDGRPDLGLIIYNPVKAEDAERIRALR